MADTDYLVLNVAVPPGSHAPGTGVAKTVASFAWGHAVDGWQLNLGVTLEGNVSMAAGGQFGVVLSDWLPGYTPVTIGFYWWSPYAALNQVYVGGPVDINAPRIVPGHWLLVGLMAAGQTLSWAKYINIHIM